jgi:hypothetical protein
VNQHNQHQHQGFDLGFFRLQEFISSFVGRTITQAVRRWLHTAAARVRTGGLVKWDLW